MVVEKIQMVRNQSQIFHFSKELRDIKEIIKKVTHFTPLNPTFHNSLTKIRFQRLCETVQF